MGFYQTMKQQYGAESVRLLKHWASLNIKLSSQRNRKIFLLSCRKNGVSPTHICNNMKNIHAILQNNDGKTGHEALAFEDKLKT